MSVSLSVSTTNNINAFAWTNTSSSSAFTVPTTLVSVRSCLTANTLTCCSSGSHNAFAPNKSTYINGVPTTTASTDDAITPLDDSWDAAIVRERLQDKDKDNDDDDGSSVEFTVFTETSGSTFFLFDTHQDIFKSTVYKKLLKGKQNKPIGIHVKSDKSTYLYSPSMNEHNDDSSRLFARTWFPGKKSKPSSVKLLEVDYGKPTLYTLGLFPLSTCILSEHGDGGSYSVSNMVTRTLNIGVGPGFGVSLALALLRIRTSFGTSSYKMVDTGGVTCNIPPGGVIQVFSDLSFVSFPDSRRRVVTMQHKEILDDDDDWEAMEPTVPSRPSLGTFLFDLAGFPSPTCVDDPNRLTCHVEPEYVGNPYEAAMLL